MGIGENRLRVRRERGVLDPGVWERIDDALVEHGIGALVDDRSLV